MSLADRLKKLEQASRKHELQAIVYMPACEREQDVEQCRREFDHFEATGELSQEGILFYIPEEHGERLTALGVRYGVHTRGDAE